MPPTLHKLKLCWRPPLFSLQGGHQISSFLHRLALFARCALHILCVCLLTLQSRLFCCQGTGLAFFCFVFGLAVLDPSIFLLRPFFATTGIFPSIAAKVLLPNALTKITFSHSPCIKNSTQVHTTVGNGSLTLRCRRGQHEQGKCPAITAQWSVKAARKLSKSRRLLPVRSSSWAMPLSPSHFSNSFPSAAIRLATPCPMSLVMMASAGMSPSCCKLRRIQTHVDLRMKIMKIFQGSLKFL